MMCVLIQLLKEFRYEGAQSIVKNNKINYL